MSLARNALQYLGVRAKSPPNLTIADRPPTTSDTAYPKGEFWLNQDEGGSYQHKGSGTWLVLSESSVAPLVSLTGDTGGAIDAVSGNLDLIGTSADGISVAGSVGQLQWAIAAATTTQRGTLETATDAEGIAAASTTVALTPSNLAALTATNLTALSASDADVFGGTSVAEYITPAALFAQKSNTSITFTQSPILESNANDGAAPSGATGDVNLMMCQEGEVMEQFIMGTGQTIIAPRMAAAGLLVSLDLTDNEGAEYNWGARSNAKNVFTIGTSAAFRLDWSFTLADVTGCDPVGIAFRKVEANNGTLESYTDFAFIGVSESDNSGTVTLKTRLNSGAVTNTDTTDAWADGENHTLSILVDGAGAVTYEIDGVAPTATAAFTFDTGDEVMPFFHGLHGTTLPGAWNWVSCKCGPQ